MDAPLPAAGHRAPAPGGARAHHRRQGVHGREPRLAPVAAGRRPRHAVLPVVDAAGQPDGAGAGAARTGHPGAGSPTPRRSRSPRRGTPRRLPAAVGARPPGRRHRRPALDGGAARLHRGRQPRPAHPGPPRVRQDDGAVASRGGAERPARALPHLVERPDAPRRGALRVVRAGRRGGDGPRLRDVSRRGVRGRRPETDPGGQPRTVRRRGHPARARHGRAVEDPARRDARGGARAPLRPRHSRRGRLHDRTRRRAPARRRLHRAAGRLRRGGHQGGAGSAEGLPRAAAECSAGGLSRAHRRGAGDRAAAR